MVYDALARRMRLSGVHECDVAELREAAEAHAHRARVRSTGSGRNRRRAMTVHAAKNREFDHVFVLWPYQVSRTAIQQRKLLYNAITRARTDAVVLVQGGKARANSDSTLRLLGQGSAP